MASSLRVIFKLQIAFLTPEVVKAFERGVDLVVSGLTKFAEFLRDDIYSYMNSFIRAISRGVKWMENMISGSGIGQAITHITSAAVQTIGAAAHRIVAEMVWGGDSAKELDKMDALNAKVQSAKTKAEYDKALDDLYKYVFKTSTFLGWESDAVDFGDLRANKYSTIEDKSARLDSRLGKYGVNTGWNQGGTGDGPWTMRDGGMDSGAESTNMLGAQPRRRISIMPMYGDLDDYVGADQSPEVKQLIRINKNLEAQLAELQAQTSANNQGLSYTKEQRDALRALRSDAAYSVD